MRKKKKAVGFKTAKRYRGGKLRPKPQVFPITSVLKQKKPHLLYRLSSIRKAKGTIGKTKLSKAALAEEKRLLAAGFKGWTIGVTYKDGTSEVIPIIARNHEEALVKARPKMNQRAGQVYEIVIIDPSLREVLHKIGAGARRVARAIGKGVYRGARFIGKVASEVIQKRRERAAAQEGRALTGESPLTVSKAERAAETVIEAEEAPAVPVTVRRKGIKVTVEVD